jgi:hypothetical protein
LPKLLQQLKDARQRGFACIGVFAAHPTRLRYTVFWDALNYDRGQNTEPSAYRFSPRRSDDEYRTALRNLRRMALAVRDLPGVEIISTRALNQRFALENGFLAWSDLRQLAQATLESSAIDAENSIASPAQILDILARGLIRLANGKPPAYLPLRTVLGPAESPPALARPVTISGEAGIALCRALVYHVGQSGCLPTSLAVDGVQVGPGALLRGVAAAFVEMERGRAPRQMTLPPGSEEPALAARLAEENIYGMLPGWPPHAPDLRLDQLALHTRLQGWSLKPAILAT